MLTTMKKRAQETMTEERIHKSKTIKVSMMRQGKNCKEIKRRTILKKNKGLETNDEVAAGCAELSPNRILRDGTVMSNSRVLT